MFLFGGIIAKGCCGCDPAQIENKKLNSLARVQLAGTIFDTVVSLTALIVGIVGLVGVLQGLPPAACWTLIGISSFISLTWIFLTVLTVALGGATVFTRVKELFQAALSSDPKNLTY